MVQVPIELAGGCEEAAHLKSRHSKASFENRGQVHNVAARGGGVGEEKQTGTRETISSRPTDVDESCKPKMSEPAKKEETKTENR